jgi:hypothetical protein
LLLLLTAGYGTFLPSQPRRAMSGFGGKAAVVQPMISMSPGLQLAREKMPRSLGHDGYDDGGRLRSTSERWLLRARSAATQI